jgi:hypothetical protein
MKFASAPLLVIGFLILTADAHSPQTPIRKSGENLVSTKECFAKGGIGIINPHLYIDLRSEKNELILEGGSRWIGQDRGATEVVFLIENKVWSSVPPGFDLGKATVVSFEGSLVRFFDFSEASGGYYKRSKE